MKNSVTLAKVAAQFATWKKVRSRKSAKFPDELNAAITEFSKHHPKSEIIRTIGISENKLYTIMKNAAATPFVELQPNLDITTSNVNCELTRPDGVILKFTAEGNCLANIVKEFLCYS